MSATTCMKSMVSVGSLTAIPGCLRHCMVAAWQGFVGTLRQLG